MTFFKAIASLAIAAVIATTPGFAQAGAVAPPCEENCYSYDDTSYDWTEVDYFVDFENPGAYDEPAYDWEYPVDEQK